MKATHKILVFLICFALSFPWMSAGILITINEEQHNFCEKIEYTGNEIELEDGTDEIIFYYPSVFDLAQYSNTEYVDFLNTYSFVIKQNYIEIVSPPPEV